MKALTILHLRSLSKPLFWLYFRQDSTRRSAESRAKLA